MCTAVQYLSFLQHTQIWWLTSIQILRCSTVASCSKTSAAICTRCGTTSKNLSSERYRTRCWSRPKAITEEFLLRGLLCKCRHHFVQFSPIIMWISWGILVSPLKPFFLNVFVPIFFSIVFETFPCKKTKTKTKQKLTKQNPPIWCWALTVKLWHPPGNQLSCCSFTFH